MENVRFIWKAFKYLGQTELQATKQKRSDWRWSWKRFKVCWMFKRFLEVDWINSETWKLVDRVFMKWWRFFSAALHIFNQRGFSSRKASLCSKTIFDRKHELSKWNICVVFANKFVEREFIKASRIFLLKTCLFCDWILRVFSLNDEFFDNTCEKVLKAWAGWVRG